MILWHFTKGLMCLSTSGNYTQVEILTGNNPLEKFSTSSEVPQNHNDLPSTCSQALPP